MATVVKVEETATVVDLEATATVQMWKERRRFGCRSNGDGLDVEATATVVVATETGESERSVGKVGVQDCVQKEIDLENEIMREELKKEREREEG